MDTSLFEKNFGLATEEYEALVKYCADNDLPFEIPNRHIAHAAILTNHILRRTRTSVDILTGSMPELFFRAIKTALEVALNAGTKARIIFVNKGTACRDLIELAKKYPERLQIFEIQDAFRENVKRRVCHFCVSDNKRFRIEEIHPDKDFSLDPGIRATASFNHPTEAKSLKDSFTDLVNLSDSIPLPSAPVFSAA